MDYVNFVSLSQPGPTATRVITFGTIPGSLAHIIQQVNGPLVMRLELRDCLVFGAPCERPALRNRFASDLLGLAEADQISGPAMVVGIENDAGAPTSVPELVARRLNEASMSFR